MHRWYTLTHLDGSATAFIIFVRKAGLLGLRGAWPWPSAEAWTILAVFGTLQAALQLGLPGAEHKGPVSPKGNVPVYKVLLQVSCPLLCIASFIMGPSMSCFHWMCKQGVQCE